MVLMVSGPLEAEGESAVSQSLISSARLGVVERKTFIPGPLTESSSHPTVLVLPLPKDMPPHEGVVLAVQTRVLSPNSLQVRLVYLHRALDLRDLKETHGWGSISCAVVPAAVFSI